MSRCGRSVSTWSHTPLRMATAEGRNTDEDRSSLEVAKDGIASGCILWQRARDVGVIHAFPTGDVYRVTKWDVRFSARPFADGILSVIVGLRGPHE